MKHASIHQPEYISASQARQFCSFSPTALRTWADSGRIKHIKSPGGKRFYYLPDIKTISGLENPKSDGLTICYSRVSSSKQRDDLNRQNEFLLQRYPDSKLISDIGSGLNYKRKGLQQLLTLIFSESVKQIIVTYRDRLCRFGFELFERIFQEYNVEFVVLMQEDFSSDTNEFSKDILDVCNFFVAKYNGKKASKYREIRKQNSFNIKSNKTTIADTFTESSSFSSKQTISEDNTSFSFGEHSQSEYCAEDEENSHSSKSTDENLSQTSIHDNKSNIQRMRLLVLPSNK